MSFFGRLFGKKEKILKREEDRFAQLVISALRERDATIQVDYDPDRFELLHVDDGARQQRMFLHNSFAEYHRQDVSLERIIDFIFESRSSAPKGDAALDKLLPVLRPRADILAAVAPHQISHIVVRHVHFVIRCCSCWLSITKPQLLY